MEQTWNVTNIYLSSIVADMMAYTLRNEGEDVVSRVFQPSKCRNTHTQPQICQFHPFSKKTHNSDKNLL